MPYKPSISVTSDPELNKSISLRNIAQVSGPWTHLYRATNNEGKSFSVMMQSRSQLPNPNDENYFIDATNNALDQIRKNINLI